MPEPAGKTRKRKGPASGFICPEHGTEMCVIHVRKHPAGIIVRRRECETCGRLVTTEERPKGAVSPPALP